MEPRAREHQSPAQELPASLGEPASSLNLCAMLGCYVVLALMLVACSPAVHAATPAITAGGNHSVALHGSLARAATAPYGPGGEGAGLWPEEVAT